MKATSLTKQLTALMFAAISLPCAAIEPGDVVINEVYFNPKDPVTGKAGGQGHSEGVELLVVGDKVNLNGLQISDRDVWNKETEEQCTLQDMGQGFLSSVPSGTLIVIYKGLGTDDTDPTDFILRFYGKTSLYCNTAPGTNTFWFANKGDNLHLLHFGKQIDFVSYRANDTHVRSPGNPGTLGWNKGQVGHVDIGATGENTGIKFLGNQPVLNDYPAAWQAYAETDKNRHSLGVANGGPNSVWVNQLREQSTKRNAFVRGE